MLLGGILIIHPGARQKNTDVAAVMIDASYKDDDDMTDDDHRKWGYAAKKHLDYAAKNAYLSYELYMRLDFYERGFFRRLYTKTVTPEVGWAWGTYCSSNMFFYDLSV